MKKVFLKLTIFICLVVMSVFGINYLSASAAVNNRWALPQEYYFYQKILTNEEKVVYNEVYEGLFNAASKINISGTVSYDNMQIIVKCVSYDHPELIWYNQTYSLSTTSTGRVASMYPDYNDLAEKRVQTLEKIDTQLAPVFDVINTLDKDIDIVKYMHDYLIHTVKYSLDSKYHQSMYSAVIDKKSVCMGYSHTMQYVLCQMGIPCTILVGESKDEYHAWNLLILDGEYYALDVTWDDPIWVDEDGNEVPDYEYYLYAYFNVTDNELDKDHDRENPSTRLPIATGKKYSFANYYKNAESARGTDFNKKGMVVPSVSSNSYANAVGLQWPGVTDARGYIIYQYVDGEYKRIDTVSSASCTIYELKNNTEYTFAVKAYSYDENGKLKYSGKYRHITVKTGGDEYIYKNPETGSILNDTTEIYPPDEPTTSGGNSNFEITTLPSKEESSKGNGYNSESGTSTIIIERPAPVRIKKMKTKKRRLIVKWTKGSGDTAGYQLQLSRSKKFKKKKTYNIKGIIKSSKKIKKLKKGKKYYVRVRAYRFFQGIKVYSKWSKVKKKKIR